MSETGAGGSEQNPTDARFCPSCGDPLPPGAATLYGDDTLNRYRATFSCPGCGYAGEVIREGGVWPNRFNRAEDFLSREQERNPRTLDTGN